MDVYDEQTTTMRVSWEKVEGATGYTLRYDAINATQPTAEQEVRDILRIRWGHSNLMKRHPPDGHGNLRFVQGGKKQKPH